MQQIFLLLSSKNDSITFLPVSVIMNYLESGLDSIYKPSAQQATNIPTKFAAAIASLLVGLL